MLVTAGAEILLSSTPVLITLYSMYFFLGRLLQKVRWAIFFFFFVRCLHYYPWDLVLCFAG